MLEAGHPVVWCLEKPRRKVTTNQKVRPLTRPIVRSLRTHQPNKANQGDLGPPGFWRVEFYLNDALWQL